MTLVRMLAPLMGILSAALLLVPKGEARADAAAIVPHATDASPHTLSAADLDGWLAGLLDYGLKSGDIAGAQIAVVKDGQLLFEGGYGYADLARKIPMDPDKTLTRLGSTSKLFTWTAVMQLVEQGRLDLNRNVDDYLDFKVSPAGGRAITLVDLMNHRGGFEEGLKGIFTLEAKGLPSNEAFLKTHPRPLLFSAGTVPAYSNYGTALAGYIVQRISGEPYEHYVENHILRPLGMQQTTFEQPPPERFRGRISQGYRSASEPPQGFELVVTSPAGSGSSTAADMARFMIAHLKDGQAGEAGILRPDTARLMHSPSEPSPPGFASMAHGFFYDSRNGRTMIGHGGDTVFFHTELELLPQEGVGIFYSFNSRGRDQSVYGLRKSLLDQFMDRYFPAAAGSAEASSPASAKADAARIAGRYETSRRIEHGFLSVFYLLQQTAIEDNGDGSIGAPKAFEPGDAQFREVAPDVWQEAGGQHRLALQTIDGVKTVLDSEDPTSVLQAVPLRRSSALNTPVLAASVLLLLTTALLWPILFWIRRHYGRALLDPPVVRRARLVLRLAALFGLVWLSAWSLLLTPVLKLQLDFYNDALDPVIRVMQVAGVVLLVLGVASAATFVQLARAPTSWRSRIGNGAIALAVLGLVWIGFAGGLLSFTLNY